MAKDNLFFKSFTKVHPRFGTPYIAIIISTIIIAVFCYGSFEALIEIAAIPTLITLYALFADEPVYWIAGGLTALTGIPAYIIFNKIYNKRLYN